MMGQRWGFTGTRKGGTAAQLEWLHSMLVERSELHHGGCVGADEEAHRWAMMIGGYHVVIHPPKDKSLAMSLDFLLRTNANTRGLPNSCYVMPSADYLSRDRAIVEQTVGLLALPGGPPRPKSGTWYTIRYARDQGKPVHICYPDGEVEVL